MAFRLRFDEQIGAIYEVRSRVKRNGIYRPRMGVQGVKFGDKRTNRLLFK